LIVLSAKDDITGNTKGVGGAYKVDEVLINGTWVE
jgi:hypothetical protein